MANKFLRWLVLLVVIASFVFPFINPTPAQAVDNPRYFVTGQVFIVNGTDTVAEAGRIATAGNTTLHIVDVGAPHQFSLYMANGTSGTLTSGTSVITGSVLALTSGLNTITATGTGTATLNLTLGTGASWVTAPAGGVNSWSASSGGQCGASVPASTDSTNFDANSFTAANQICTIDSTANTLNMSWTGATNTPTLAGTTAGLNVYGNCTFILAMNYTFTYGLLFSAVAGTQTLTTNGLSLACAVIQSGASTVSLADALTTTDGVAHRAGTFTTNNNTINCLFFSSNGYATTRTQNWGTTTITTTSATGFNNGGTNITCNGTTATFIINGTGAFNGGVLAAGSYGTVNLNGTAHTVSGNNTVVNFTRNGTATKTDSLTLTSGSTQTVTGTCALIGNSAVNRLLVQSSVLGSPATLHVTTDVAAVWTGTNAVDFMDITSTHAVDLSAAGLNPAAYSGDCGGNTGITCTASAAQTSGSTATWSTAAKWTSRVPLPQDDVTCSHNTTVDMPRIGRSITITGSPVMTYSVVNDIYRSLSLSATQTGTWLPSNVIRFRGRATGMPLGGWTLTTAGTTLGAIVIICYGATLSTVGTTTSSNYVYVDSGEFSLGGDITMLGFLTGNIVGGLPRTLTMNGHTMTLNGTVAIAKFNGVLTTVSANAGTIIFTNSGVAAQSFVGNSQTYNNVTVQGAGAYALTVSGNNTFNSFTMSQSVDSVGFTGNNTISSLVVDRTTSNKTITETAGTNQTVTAITCTTSGTRTLTINSTAGTATLTKAGGGTVWIDYISLANNTGAPANTWYYGSNNTIGANVNGWSAAVGPTVITVAATGITTTTANLNGEITATGGINSTVRGFDWDIDSGAPYANNWNEVGSYGISSFTTNSQTFPSGVTIYFRAYATNPAGTGNGAESSFLTLVGAPTGLTVTYVNDHEAGLTWTIAPSSIATQIRAAYGREPTSMTDGYLVYNGLGGAISDYQADLDQMDYTIFYRAWAQRADGVWGTAYADADTGAIMKYFTESYTAYVFIGLAVVCMVFGFVFAKKGAKWIFYLAMFAWILAGFYAFSQQTSLLSVVHFLGLFCILAALGCMLMPVIMRDKKPPVEVKKPMTSEEYTEMLRAMRYGKRAGYDKSGNKTQGW
jgi:hypothetical protein